MLESRIWIYSAILDIVTKVSFVRSISYSSESHAQWKTYGKNPQLLFLSIEFKDEKLECRWFSWVNCSMPSLSWLGILFSWVRTRLVFRGRQLPPCISSELYLNEKNHKYNPERIFFVRSQQIIITKRLFGLWINFISCLFALLKIKKKSYFQLIK